MKKTFYKAMLACMGLALTVPAFADESIDVSKFVLETEQHKTINDGMQSFATELLEAVPQATTQDNVWADAYIGKLFPSVIPHLGGGISVGVTQMDMTGLKTAAEELQTDYNQLGTLATTLGLTDNFDQINFEVPDTFFLPSVSLDLRIGGVILPFDIGLCAMMTSPNLSNIDFNAMVSENPDFTSLTNASNGIDFDIGGFKGTVNYMVLGADARYCIYEGNVILPKISVGGGYYFAKGSFAIGSESDSTKAGIQTSYESHIVFAQVEASKSFAIATAFGGLRGVLNSTTTAWAWNYETTYNGVTISDSDSGTETLSTLGKEYISTIQPQAFLGAGFNFLFFQTSLNVCADLKSICTAVTSQNFNDVTWSGAFSFHAKL